MKRISLSLFILLWLAACSTAQPAPTSTPVMPTNQPQTPTPKPTATAEDPAPYTVTVDDTGCTADIPETLPLGKHSFLIKNSTENDFALWVFMIPEDTTFQEFVDKSVNLLGRRLRWDEMHTPALVALRSDDASGGKFYTFSFYEEGDYGTSLGLDEKLFSFCTPFSITSE